jgi:hypothetical protein
MILTASIGVRPFNLVEHTTGSGLPQHPSRDLAAVSRRVGSKGICLQSPVGCAPGFNIAKPLPRSIRGAFVVSQPPNSAAHSATWVARYWEIPMFACRHIRAIQLHGGPRLRARRLRSALDPSGAGLSFGRHPYVKRPWPDVALAGPAQLNGQPRTCPAVSLRPAGLFVACGRELKFASGVRTSERKSKGEPKRTRSG